jgi:hypothetical protein
MYIKFRTSQQKKTKRPKRDLFREDPRSYANRLTNTTLRVLNTIISFSNSYKHVFPSHQKIADICGVHYITVGRLLRELRRDGLVTWHSTPHRSNSYVINPILKKPWMANILQFVLPALRNFVFATFSISLLSSGVKEELPNGVCCSYFSSYSYIYKAGINGSITRNEEMRARGPSEGNARNFAKKEGERVTDRKERGSPTEQKAKTGGGVFDFKICGCKLTIAGMTELSAFSKEAIEHGRREMSKLGAWKPSDPFSYFFSVCKKWHENYKIPLNYGLVNKARSQIGATGYEPKLEVVGFATSTLTASSGFAPEARTVDPSSLSASPRPRGKAKEEETVTIHRTAEQVEAEIRAMEEDPLTAPFAGALRARCQEALRNGETIHTTSAQVERRSLKQKKFIEDMDRLRVSREGDAGNEKQRQGGATTNDFEVSQAKIFPEYGTCVQFEPGVEIEGVPDRWESVGTRTTEILTKNGKGVRLPETGKTG